jgi:hypothetical protein
VKKKLENFVATRLNKKLLYIIGLFFFGFWSLILGQDRSFDLAGYHLYNGFSFLNNKIETDFAVSGVQSYLNPLHDAFFYYLNSNIPPKLFGFLMGFIHALNFVLIYEIIILILKPYNLSNYDKFLLLIASILSCNFLGGLGNSSGDNFLSILILTSVLISLKSLEIDKNLKNKSVFFSGFLIGIASALKLTNGIYSPAFMLAILSTNSTLNRKVFLCLIFGFSFLLGLLLFGGQWYLKIWYLFQNPIFPYFSNLFQNNYSNYVNPTLSWMPKNFLEYIFWPLIFSVNYHRVGEGSFNQIIWPIFYILILLAFFKRLFTLLGFGDKKANILESERFILFFTFFSYIFWVKLFCVLRYLVAIELLLPLTIFILYSKLPKRFSHMINFRFFLYISIALTLFGGFSTWGHSSWTNPPFKVELPNEIKSNDKITIILAGGAPMSWMATQFPVDYQFIKLGIFNAEKRIHEVVSDKDRKIYTMFGAYYNWREDNVKKWESILTKFSMLDSYESCTRVDKFIKKVHFRGKIVMNDQDSCNLTIKDSDYISNSIGDQFFYGEAEKEISRFNFNMSKDKCSIHNAFLGSQKWRYMFCETKYK